ncbi:hypothetical protein EV421DRAFT_1738936 [Armillaria borealis]|uniref:Uncharacterized protein n=1 Tax=Armillaria borealis TaxID=47425 RepID=A0AA39J7Y2_9AGAR|nr:hypothetical protein EV421DRAFT_1738936 [Armillaria borealis]
MMKIAGTLESMVQNITNKDCTGFPHATDQQCVINDRAHRYSLCSCHSTLHAGSANHFWKDGCHHKTVQQQKQSSSPPQKLKYWNTSSKNTTLSQHTIGKQCGGHHHRNRSNEKPNHRNTLSDSVAAGVDLATVTGMQVARYHSIATHHWKMVQQQEQSSSPLPKPKQQKTTLGTGNKRMEYGMRWSPVGEEATRSPKHHELLGAFEHQVLAPTNWQIDAQRVLVHISAWWWNKISLGRVEKTARSWWYLMMVPD